MVDSMEEVNQEDKSEMSIEKILIVVEGDGDI